MILAQGAQDDPEARPPASRQNPILRDYFRRQITNMRGLGGVRNRRDDPFLEDYVDRQIDHFLEELRGKMDLIRSHQEEIVRERERIQEAPSRESEREARSRLESALDSLQKRTSDVWNLLRYIFTDLEGKGTFELTLTRKDHEELFGQQTAFMAEEMKKAEDQIERYFFGSVSTVHLSELHGENMLIHLYRVRETARKLKDALEP